MFSQNTLISLFAISLLVFNHSLFACDEGLPSQGIRDDVLVLVNDNAVDSCAVGDYYAQQRQLGKNNILHVRTPANYFIDWQQFKLLRDQIIVGMQQRATELNPGFTPHICTGQEQTAYADTATYCQASIEQLRAVQPFSYLVTTKGFPTRVKFVEADGQVQGNTPTVDAALRFWLARHIDGSYSWGAHNDPDYYYFSQGKLNALDGDQALRSVNPEADLELMVGRVDGMTLDAAKQLVDRTLEAERNGVYGNLFSTDGNRNALSVDHDWDDAQGKPVYTTDDSKRWRYMFGIFDESRPECADYATNYLSQSASSAAGKSPTYCKAQFNGSAPPGTQNSRHYPVLNDALVFHGDLDSQSTLGDFSALMNWHHNASCTNTLCSQLSGSEQDDCRAASVDVFKEIDSRCVGVAKGFIGTHHISWPVAHYSLYPTNWWYQTSLTRWRHMGASGETMYLGRPRIVADDGYDGSDSLWFGSQDEVASPLCYADDTELESGVPTRNCRDEWRPYLTTAISLPAETYSAGNPQTYNVSLWIKTEGIEKSSQLRLRVLVKEVGQPDLVNYGTLALNDLTQTDMPWTMVSASFQIDPAKHAAGWDQQYDGIQFLIESSGTIIGRVGLDGFSVVKQGSSTELAVNGSFDQGHEQVSSGDWAANFINRMGGVAFWGSASHYHTGGFSFGYNQMTSLIYWLRGLPIADAAWANSYGPSGLLYGDPLYSPVAVNMQRPANEYRGITGVWDMAGSALNGNDPSQVTTTYDVSYCPGSDFYVCDQNAQWLPTGISGTGGFRDGSLGSWDVSSLAPGFYTLRLSVRSINASEQRDQTFNDLQTVYVYNDSSDADNDLLPDSVEFAPGSITSPHVQDMDHDGVIDGLDDLPLDADESVDTDGDGIGNNADTDDDNDLIPDTLDPAPLTYVSYNVITNVTVYREADDGWDYGYVYENVGEGTAMNDYIDIAENADYKMGGAGDDVIILRHSEYVYGGPGDDTFVVTSELDPSASIAADDTEGFDTLYFANGITRADVTIERTNSSGFLRLSYTEGGQEKSVVLERFFNNYSGVISDTAIGQVVFSDGEVLTTAELARQIPSVGSVGSDQLYGDQGANELYGLGGDDWLYGFEGDDRIEGGPGNDYLLGNQGDDVYVFGPGSDTDYIFNQSSGYQVETDVIKLFAATDIADVWLIRDVNNLDVYSLGTNDRVIIYNWYGDDSYQVDRIELGNYAINASQMEQLASLMTTIGTPVNGVVTPTAEQQTQLDTEISAAWYQNNSPVAPLTWVDTDGDGLEDMADPDDDNDQLNDLYDPRPLLAEVYSWVTSYTVVREPDDSWDQGYATEYVGEGSAGNDVIDIAEATDYIQGLDGNDVIILGDTGYVYGGSGNDTFIIEDTIGEDVTIDADDSAGIDVVKFVNGINKADLAVQIQSYSGALKLSYMLHGKSHLLTLNRFFQSNSSSVSAEAIDQIVFSDGSTLSQAEIASWALGI